MSVNEQEMQQDIESGLDINVDENMSGTSKMNDEMSTDNELEKLKAEVEEWKDKYTRLIAEFDNYKKRSFKEKMETIQTAGREIIVSLLDVVDDTERAEKQMETAANLQALKEGTTLVFNKLKHTLQNKGLKAFESKGEVFDVEKHEAVTEIPVQTEDMVGKVVDELQKGYYLNDKLIRHAKVVVGKGADA
jgi:molecular chaperone GrpE